MRPSHLDRMNPKCPLAPQICIPMGRYPLMDGVPQRCCHLLMHSKWCSHTCGIGVTLQTHRLNAFGQLTRWECADREAAELFRRGTCGKQQRKTERTGTSLQEADQQQDGTHQRGPEDDEQGDLQFHFRRQIIQQFVTRVEVNEDKTIKVYLEIDLQDPTLTSTQPESASGGECTVCVFTPSA